MGDKTKATTRSNAPPIDVLAAYDQQPAPSADDYIADPDYSADAYI